MDQPTAYEIRVQGHLDPSWSPWLDGISIVHRPDGTTTLGGVLADQAALYGLLSKLRDAGVILLSVTQKESDEQA